MRLNDLNGGSIKTLLILALLATNVAVALSPGSARGSRAGFRGPAETKFPSDPRSPATFAMASTPSLPQSRDDAPALSDPLPP